MNSFVKRNIDISEINLATKVPAGTGSAVHKNRSSHGFALHVGGEKEYVFNGVGLKVGKNDIIYMPKGSDYRVKNFENGDCFAINFQVYDDFAGTPFVFTPKNPAELLELFKAAEKLWRNKENGYLFGCKAALYRILQIMQSEAAATYFPSSKNEKIKPALDFINKNYTTNEISVEKLSEMCSMSEVYFRKIFSRAFGMSPVRYIRQLRIKRAAELLSSGLYTVATVAEMSGFSDVSYFSREFKKLTGMSPSHYIE